MAEELRYDPVPDTHAPFVAAADRYASTGYRRVGNSGLILPPISLGLWWNFGDNRPFDTQREVLRHAFEHGITHFDLANNYGPPHGSAEENFGRMMRTDFKAYRNELIISSKAGWDMWPGPYGILGSRKYIMASADESLARMNLDYVDIFYSHRPDPDTPIEETIGALDTLVRQGKALYVGISSYSPERTAQAARVAKDLGTPLVIHQPSYSMLNRWVEDGLLDTLSEHGMGSIAFTPLAQGLLTNKYLSNEAAVPSGGRNSLQGHLTEENLSKARALAQVAESRGQSLAQLAIAWLLREGGVTSVLLGASSTAQLDENLGALGNTTFSTEELEKIDRIVAGEAGIDHWRSAATS
ncbi:aldo/keto reductase [Paeniglutamicibacter gangotriensis]|uniref:Oxidoreductase n=2 Tax=Paeniglutamicibacter gangotriensis TaxID=254787 RepID=M7MUB8_9MICC|nr:aldo/keto reductase [Paeniglutamicibacter gangotriensis]EMQ98530.1 oxidoreductase [Paeniglutamicibacter gangotriensis Lz1y]KAA0975212.1 aldo/keto reductase [Paeniglutamicibacter gangotriensis]